MRFTSLALAALLPLAFANPIPEDEISAAGVTGVNITNLNIAGTDKAVKNSYIVVFKDSVTEAEAEKHENAVGKKLGKSPKDRYKVNGFKGYHVETDKAGLAKIGKDPLVAFVEIDGKTKITPTIVNTTDTSGAGTGASTLLVRNAAPWGLARISHRVRGIIGYFYDSTGCSGTRIYILDTGIRVTHTEFNGRAVLGRNFIAGSLNIDEHGHGTHCAGTAAGRTIGVCRSATVVSVKVLGASGGGSISGLISGIQWATNDAIARGYRNKAVLSISIEAGYSASLNAAVQGAINKGIPVVVAAGNSDINAISVSPASAVNAITVGATDYYDERAYFSNWGTLLDVFAPGVDILSSYKNSNTNYAYLSGTSQATPHVSGVVAYLMRKESIYGPAKIRARIVALSTKNKIFDTKGSYNRLLYNNSGR